MKGFVATMPSSWNSPVNIVHCQHSMEKLAAARCSANSISKQKPTRAGRDVEAARK
jgi:hypothetical protein